MTEDRGSAAAHAHSGNDLLQRGRHAEALGSYDRALALAPDNAETLNNRGVALLGLKRYAEALASFDRALALNTGYAQAHNNRGIALRELGRHEDAIASYNRAIAIRPDYAEAHNNRGNALRALRRHEEALSSYEQALAVRPDYAEAHNNRGNALRDLGRMEEAAALYRRSLAINPRIAATHHALIYTLLRTSRDPAAVTAECRAFAAAFEPGIARLSHSNSREPERRLKVGYVSGDFRDHALASFIGPILARHDRNALEIFCYSTHASADGVTGQLLRHADHSRSIAALSDDAAAALVQQDRIDILVDLSGHTAHNRLLMFARKPAPVQVTWMGVPCTTGLSAIDYRFTNGYSDPAGAERYYTETLVRVSSPLCYEPPAPLPEVSALPALTTGLVTLASFNQLDKLSPAVYALWARLLKALPESRLMLIGEEPQARFARAAFSAHGVDAARLQICGRLPLADYLALHDEVDIALDPFPYSGSTTSRNCFLMGVPVVSLTGPAGVSRVGFALLAQIGLDAFAATSESEYAAIVLRWAHDLDGLAQIRRTLRSRLQDAPLSDAASYTREVETAYRQMWRRWCGDRA